MQMPEPDQSVIDRRDTICRDLRNLISDHSVVDSVEGRRAYDADGLSALAAAGDWSTLNENHLILTPHIGEMATISGLEKDFIRENKLSVASQFAVDTSKFMCWFKRHVWFKLFVSAVCSRCMEISRIPWAQAALRTSQ